MANCVLCGQKLGMFDKVKIDFHNTKQSVCSDCANRLDNTVGPERAELFRQILDSPYLENGEDIRADINTGKPCPACGAILHRKLRNFSIGSDGYGGLSSLGLPSYEVDLYACPQCGKVELYTAAPGAWAPDRLSQLRCASGWIGPDFPPGGEAVYQQEVQKGPLGEVTIPFPGSTQYRKQRCL